MRKEIDPKKEVKTRAKRVYKSAEAEERVKAHQFGQRGGNLPMPQKRATEQREFYHWLMVEATEKEVDAYIKNKSNPAMRIKLCQLFKQSESITDFLNMTNQIYGAPKQQVEIQAIPPVYTMDDLEDDSNATNAIQQQPRIEALS